MEVGQKGKCLYVLKLENEICVKIVCVCSLEVKKQLKKHFMNVEEAAEKIQANLVKLQSVLQADSKILRQENTRHVTSRDEFTAAISSGEGLISAIISDNDEIWNGIKSEYKFTPRCIKLDDVNNWGECIFTGGKGRPTILGKAY